MDGDHAVDVAAETAPERIVLRAGSLWLFAAGEEVAGAHTDHRVLALAGLDLDLVRTPVGSQKDPDCRGREPVAFCRGGTLLGAELGPVLWYAENEVGELRCSEPGVT
jgi:hypothetical protein